LIADYRHEVLRTAVDEASQGIAHTGDAAIVELHHYVSEGNEHEKVHKFRHAETWAALSGG